MSFEVREFVPEELRTYADMAAEESLRPYLKALDFDVYDTAGPAWSGYWNGEPVGAAGFMLPYGRDNTMRAIAWAILFKRSGPWFAHVHRYVKRGIAASPYRRIETEVYCDFDDGHRWVRALGFTLETERKPYWAPDGAAVSSYVIIRDTP